MQNDKSLVRPQKLAEKKGRKIHGASKPKKSDLEHNTSIDRNKFQRPLKKTKRNVRI